MIGLFNALYQNTRPCSIEDVCDVYTYVAHKYNIDRFRILDIDGLMKSGIKRGIDLNTSFYDFIGEQGKVLVIVNKFNDTIISYKVKPLKAKQYRNWVNVKGIPYTLEGFKDFHYGDPVVIVEGEKDRELVNLFYPYVIALSTSSMSLHILDLIIGLTNKVILAYDNDESGREGIKRDTYRLRQYGISNDTITYPSDVKDIGTVFDLEYIGDTFNSEYLFGYFSYEIKNKIDGLRERI